MRFFPRFPFQNRLPVYAKACPICAHKASPWRTKGAGKWGFIGKMARTGGNHCLTVLPQKQGKARKGAEKAWQYKKEKNAGK
jgi:hypothetical protein